MYLTDSSSLPVSLLSLVGSPLEEEGGGWGRGGDSDGPWVPAVNGRPLGQRPRCCFICITAHCLQDNGHKHNINMEMDEMELISLLSSSDPEAEHRSADQQQRILGFNRLDISIQESENSRDDGENKGENQQRGSEREVRGRGNFTNLVIKLVLMKLIFYPAFNLHTHQLRITQSSYSLGSLFDDKIHIYPKLLYVNIK